MTPRRETAAGVINALQLCLFLAGALTFLLWKDAPVPDVLTKPDAALDLIALVLCIEAVLCLSPLALVFQPSALPLLGAASCLEARVILQGESGGVALRLLLLLLLVPLCFLLGGRGIWNALLLTRAIRTDPDGLGRSVRLSLILLSFAPAALWLLWRILRYA